MIIKNGNIFIDGKFTTTDLKIENGVITEIGNLAGDNILDCSDKFVLPGLVDIHTHGCIGQDFSSSDVKGIHEMQKYYLDNGITSLLATTVAMNDDNIISAVGKIKSAMNDSIIGADILGVNMEGPYLSPKKCGAHDITLLKEPDIKFTESLGDIIKIVDLAPEYRTSMDFIKKFKGKVSIAHTDCDYETAMKAINAGANHITHIFNAMNGIHHRKPGVIGAFSDSQAIAEIICDGIHIHESVLRMMFKSFGDRLAVISDSMSATGFSDGEYSLGKLNVFVNNSVATLKDGTLAGSTMNIFDMMKKLISFGVDAETAISSVTHIPADSVDMGHICGRIKTGRKADIVITGKNFNRDKVVFNGKVIN